jgi:glycosyltransferase involved in cell wall biosynthesis
VSAKILFVLKGYPRLSETFIAEEIFGLEQAGADIRILALRRPTDATIHPVHRQIRAEVGYLPEYLHEAPLRVLGAVWRLRRCPRWRAVLRCFYADLKRDLSRNRLRRLGQAAVLAAELPDDITHLHAHFIHTPASVVRYASLLLGLPWSCSAHAKDIWTSPDWDIAEKLQSARWTVTCTKAGQARLQALNHAGRPVHLLYHGLRLDRFRPLLPPPSRRDGRDPADPVRLLAVGRAVEKKGFDRLVEALAGLPQDCAWHLTHIGGGPALKALRAMAHKAGIAERITWEGPQDQTAVLKAYGEADLFVLPCRIAADGDRDGLPNVLVEAQSQGLACVSTTVGGVAELILTGETGLLVPPDDVAALRTALRALIGDPHRRRALGRAGAQRVAGAFDAAASAKSLLALFGGAARTAEAEAAE